MLIVFTVPWEFILFNFDTKYQIYAPKIRCRNYRKGCRRNAELQPKSQNLRASEHVFRGSVRKSFRKEVLLHQMKCNFICKHFASNPINTYVCCYWASNACICCCTIFCCWLCACDCCEKTCRTLLTCLCCPIQISLNSALSSTFKFSSCSRLVTFSFLKILALRRLDLFSCRPHLSVIWRVSLKLFMAI